MEIRKFDNRLIRFFRTADLGPIIHDNLISAEHLNSQLSFVRSISRVALLLTVIKLWFLYIWYNDISSSNNTISMNEAMQYQLRDLIKEYILEYTGDDDIIELAIKAIERPDEIIPAESKIFNCNNLQFYELIDFARWCSHKHIPTDNEMSLINRDHAIVEKAYSYKLTHL